MPGRWVVRRVRLYPGVARPWSRMPGEIPQTFAVMDWAGVAWIYRRMRQEGLAPSSARMVVWGLLLRGEGPAEEDLP